MSRPMCLSCRTLSWEQQCKAVAWSGCCEHEQSAARDVHCAASDIQWPRAAPPPLPQPLKAVTLGP